MRACVGDTEGASVCAEELSVTKLRVPSRARNGCLIVSRDETVCEEFNT